MSRTFLWSATFACLWLAGCTKDTAEPAQELAAELTAEPEHAHVIEPTKAAPTADTLPIPEDFADEAAQQVTRANYQEQVAALEKELADEPAP